MDKSVINKSTLSDIADAIREKDGTSDNILVSAFASRILDIPSGSGNCICSSGDFTPVADDTDELYIEHELGVVPDVVIVVADVRLTVTNSIQLVISADSIHQVVYGVSSSPRLFIENWVESDEDAITITQSSGRFWKSNTKYNWYAYKIN